MSNGRKQAVSWRESGIAREKTRWREREGLGVGIKRAEPNERSRLNHRTNVEDESNATRASLSSALLCIYVFQPVRIRLCVEPFPAQISESNWVRKCN